MKKIVINGDKVLSGTIKVSGAKNSAVALIPAALLSDGIVKIENVPNGVPVDLAPEHESAHHGEADGLLVRHGKRAGIPQAHGADVRVRLASRLQQARAEHLGLGLELDVRLQPDRVLEFHLPVIIAKTAADLPRFREKASCRLKARDSGRHRRRNASETGGGGGIRTPGGVAPTQPFQGCTIDHSDTPPVVFVRRQAWCQERDSNPHILAYSRF